MSEPIDLRARMSRSPSPRPGRRPFRKLHPDFVAAVRAAVKEDWPLIRSGTDLHRAPWRNFAAIHAGDGPCGVVAREGSPESRRLRRLADAIGYRGPILGEAAA